MMFINGQAIYVIWLRDVKRFIRARSRLLGNIVQPFFFLSILGFGLSSAIFPGIPSGYRFIDFLTPGIVAMAVLFSSIFSGVSVLWDKQFGFLQEVLVAPVSRLSIVIGRTFGGATTALMQGFVILAIALALGVKVSLIGLATGILFMVLLAFSAVGFGLIVASQMEDFHGFQLIMNLIIFPLFFLSSAIFPIEGLPNWLKAVAFVNPLTYGVDGLRYSLIGFSSIPIWIDLSVLLAFCMVMVSVGSYLFGRSEA
jgi:ABC-2 type transport system permease protein